MGSYQEIIPQLRRIADRNGLGIYPIHKVID